MAIMPSAPEPFIPYALPVCPSWCAGGHHEPGGTDPDGVRHYSAGPELLFHDITNTVSGRPLRRGGYGFDAALVRHDEWSGKGGLDLLQLVVTALHEPVGLVEVLLSGSEARTVARTLELMADRADGLR